MEIILTIAIFAISFLLLSVGVIFGKKHLHAGSCGSGVIVNGHELSCGACPSKEAQVCPSGDQEGYATLAQLGNPTRKRIYRDHRFSAN
jgi:hypothetical protein